MREPSIRVIFISDLDGTLLSQSDFRFDEIKDAILELLTRGINLIPASSKTKTEIESFCQSLGVELPFICENGAALVNGHLLRRKNDQKHIGADPKILGLDQAVLLTTWRNVIPTKFQQNCVFLDDMENASQQAILGLAGEALAQAMDRSHTALFIFQGTTAEFDELREQAARAELMLQCGGRVCSLSALHDKASYHQWIRKIVADEDSVSLLVGFGDAQNDISMLQSCDIACIIPRPNCQPLILPKPPSMLVQTKAVAPLGWLETARQALVLIEQKYGEQNG